MTYVPGPVASAEIVIVMSLLLSPVMLRAPFVKVAVIRREASQNVPPTLAVIVPPVVGAGALSSQSLAVPNMMAMARISSCGPDDSLVCLMLRLASPGRLIDYCARPDQWGETPFSAAFP